MGTAAEAMLNFVSAKRVCSSAFGRGKDTHGDTWRILKRVVFVR